MRALTVVPRQSGSARLDDVPDPPAVDGAVLVEVMAIGVCGTDLEIVAGDYGWAPPGKDRLILGHESLGRVVEAPDDSDFKPGDLVVGIVRRPDPDPCPSCAAGEWDMCRNGKYTERGIKEHDGYCSDRYRIHPEFAVKVEPGLGRLGILVEPTSVVAKAWEQIERIGHRAEWSPKRVLVTGAGPIGLLAALLGVQRGLEVHVLDHAKDGPKPDLARDLGATYHGENLEKLSEHVDIVIECTGVSQVIFDVLAHSTPDRIVCLAGVCSKPRSIEVDPMAINNGMVLDNGVVFGSVNANRRHYEAGADALNKADRDWLGRLITRRVPLDRWHEALERRPGDVKAVITLRDQ